MEGHGRPPFGGKFPFQKKVDNTWYANGSQESAEYMQCQEDEYHNDGYERNVDDAYHEEGTLSWPFLNNFVMRKGPKFSFIVSSNIFFLTQDV